MMGGMSLGKAQRPGRASCGGDGLARAKGDGTGCTGMEKVKRAPRAVMIPNWGLLFGKKDRSHLMCLYKTDVNVNLHRLTVQKTESYWSKKMPE